MTEELRRPDTWAASCGITILDPDGWRGRNGRPWEDAISWLEFRHRAIQSTLMGGYSGALTGTTAPDHQA